jgi:hypothetical protein
MMTAIYNSRFIKAEIRIPTLQGGCKMYTTQPNDGLSVHDIYIPAGENFILDVAAKGQNILFPIVGGIIAGPQKQQLAPGDIYYMPAGTESNWHIHNPFSETVNFLYISITTEEAPGESLASIGLSVKNQLVQGSGYSGNIKVGVYDSRVKGLMPLQPNMELFTYIINGSFEVDGRLMEYRDALYQWDITETDYDALSEAAIILMIECSSFKQ